MTFVVPCARPENNPDDWFIDKAGKQYQDDEPTTPGLLAWAREHILDIEDETPPEREERLYDLAEAEAVRHALIRRRQAKDKCFVECIHRLSCLGQGLEVAHGTFGGYYEEERRKIVDLRDKKRKERAERRAEMELREGADG